MKIFLNELVSGTSYPYEVTLDQRLPSHLIAPCLVRGSFQVETRGQYTLLELITTGSLRIHCQRCLGEFTLNYENRTQLALCPDEDTAEQLMHQYECVVVMNKQVDMDAILTDELYLFTDKTHVNRQDCDTEISHLIRG